MEIKKSASLSIETAKEMSEVQRRTEERQTSSAGIAGTADTIESFNLPSKIESAFNDRLTPQWTDLNDNDPGISLLEAMAFAADALSFYQDRISSESYLNTAGDQQQLIDLTADIRTRFRTDIMERMTASDSQKESDDDD